MTDALSGKAAIVGIGATEFSKNSGRSELRLAVEAITAALEDAGIDREEVDGLCTYTMDPDLLEGLRVLRERDGVSASETVRRSVRAFLEKEGALKSAERPAPSLRRLFGRLRRKR